jgi:CxC5 like cysteine cluster associated with KDZ transposases
MNYLNNLDGIKELVSNVRQQRRCEINFRFSSYVMLSNVCTNESCPNTKPLKKEKPQRVIIYTLANGAQPAWLFSLSVQVNVKVFDRFIVLTNTLLACNTQYHSNFSVHEGQRTYYPGIPEFIEVGKHQFVEQVVARMWITNLLLGWSVYTFYLFIYCLSLFTCILNRVSASNSAKAYDLVLSSVGIGTGNPGVFPGYPHPYPGKPVPAPKVRVFGR